MRRISFDNRNFVKLFEHFVCGILSYSQTNSYEHCEVISEFGDIRYLIYTYSKNLKVAIKKFKDMSLLVN